MKSSIVAIKKAIGRVLHVMLLLIAATLIQNPAFADDPLSEDQIKALALEAIRENPEIIAEALQRLEQLEEERREAQIASALNERRDDLQNDPNAPVLGNPDGDITIVEFFDYNCPYCRRVKPEIAALLEADKNVRLVYREWPILGEGSVFAAKAALAARNQGLYEAFHWSLMALEERANEQSVMRVAEEEGLDVARLREDMNDALIDQHIQLSMELAQALNITGTPTFIVRDAVLPGLVPAQRLMAEISRLRDAPE